MEHPLAVLESADTVKADGKPFFGGDERLRSEVVRLISDADEEARRFVSTACIADFNEMDDADHAHYPWENAPSITVDGIVPGALAYYAAALSDSAAAMD
ncbi:hypothetical protein M885DRAFT_579475, partial [Pelagophyceae sp. CCMP2097]